MYETPCFLQKAGRSLCKRSNNGVSSVAGKRMSTGSPNALPARELPASAIWRNGVGPVSFSRERSENVTLTP